MPPIDVFTLARTGAVREGTLPLAALPRLAAGLLDSEGDVAYRAQGFVDALGRPALRLRLQADLVLRCDRCDGRLPLRIDDERLYFFVHDEAALAAIAVDEAPEEALLGSTRFDLAGLVEDEAILQLPLSPRHADCPVAPGVAGARPADERPKPFAGLQALRDELQRREPGGSKGQPGPAARPARRRRPA
jgi:uncharacterized protein